MQDLPIFIGGFRSGTTLLINLLGLHPQVTPWFETRDLCEAVRWQHVLAHPDNTDFERAYCAPAEPAGFTLDAVHGRLVQQARDTAMRLAGGASGKAAHERYVIGNDYVRYSLAEAEAAMQEWRASCAAAGVDSMDRDSGAENLAAVAAANGRLITKLGTRHVEIHGAGPWINKTPEITRFAPELRAALGRCKIIYMIRDGIQVVASGHRLGWGSVELMAFNWKGLLERTRAAMAACPEDYLELRYEQLVLDPVATLDRVLAFCGRTTEGAALVREFIASEGEKAFDVSRLQ
ncbi:MAG: sulfotransferase, partial [Pseudomonadota bacterium]|nr:sulfotransferase [Pseudomonadota bacterium]